MNESSFFETWKPRVLSVLRIISALLLVQHGSQKLFGLFDSPGIVPTFSQMWVAGILEFFGGSLLALGSSKPRLGDPRSGEGIGSR